MSDPDSLVATRARRANAGSRLKQLIEIEEQATGVSNIVYSEDDENVQLLFQEDENDEEFEQSQASDSDLEEDNGEDGSNDENEPATVDDTTSTGEKVSDTEAAVNSDEMLSDSDLSASENDDSEGERELQKAEKSKKRKSRGGPVIPAIKKPKLPTEKPKPKQKTKHSELLLNLDRRASSRKSAMRNKEVLVKKLKEDESRRAALTPVVRAKEVKLTQEERLAQAIETEKENVISLHSFLQQEIVKKEHQKLLFQQRRLKLRNVIRLISRETFVAPIDEIEDARHVIDLFDKKKRGRRRKSATDVPEDPRPGDIDKELPYYKKEMEEIRLREEKEAAEKERIEKEREERRRIAAVEEEKWKLKLEEERESRRSAKEERFKEYENVDITGSQHIASDEGADEVNGNVAETMPTDLQGLSHDGDSTALVLESREPSLRDAEKEDKEDKSSLEDPEKEDMEEDKGEEAGEKESEEPSDIKAVESTPSNVTEEVYKSISEKSGLEKADPSNEDLEKDEIIEEEHLTPRTADGLGEDTEMAETEPSIAEIVEEPKPGSKETPEAATNDQTEDLAATPSESTEPKVAEEKRVTFADMDADSGAAGDADEADSSNEVNEEILETAAEEEEIEDAPEDLTYRASKEGQIFEGPVQQVSKNHVILVDFDEDLYYPYLTEARIKTVLFGADANLGTSRKFKDVKTILKSSIRSENPYGSVQEKKEDELMKPISAITEDDAIFESLKRLPRLGVKEVFEEEEKDVQEEETAAIQIHTEAPTGLYLPNGNRKLCLISGKEVRYFDPATGIPYENKDVYKIIKTIESGLIPWYSIPSDQNAYGKVEMYLNHREGSRHAKGVPEGFDGC